MVSQTLLAKAADSFQFHPNTLVFISNSCNEVYRFARNNEFYILRLSEKPSLYADKIKAEVDWISYLVEHGVQASMPIKTRDNKLVAIYDEEGKFFIATAFHMAVGVSFDKNDPQLWGPAIFTKWGETMGHMHKLTKSYSAPDVVSKRDSWSMIDIANPFLQQAPYCILVEKLKWLENRINELPQNSDSFGLIHNDFHPYNFFVDKGEITVFDFDDSIYGWFALDIAIAATHAVWWGSPKEDRKSKNEFAKQFLHAFLEGYFTYNQLDRYWVEQIPMLMEYRNICSYFWWLNGWDGDEGKLSDHQKDAIGHAVKLIKAGMPFDGCDFAL